jgi:hypothetical protein
MLHLQQAARHPFVCEAFRLRLAIIPADCCGTVRVDLYDSPRAASVDAAGAVAGVKRIRTCDVSYGAQCVGSDVESVDARWRERGGAQGIVDE